MDEHRERLLVVVVTAVALLVVGLTHRDFGVTWDEGVQARYGDLSLAYFASGFEDRRFVDYHDLRYYGPVVETVLAALYGPWPESRFDVRHLALGLLAVALIPVLAGYAGHFGSSALPVLSVLALVMIPRLIGHAPNNSKDVPFALAVCLYMLALVRLFGLRRMGWRSIAFTALAAGFALAVRPGGLPLLGTFFLTAALLAHRQRPLFASNAELWGLAQKFALLWLVAWAIMVASWPWAHEAPIAHPLEAIFRSASFDRAYPVLFEGRMLDSDQLPRLYLLKYLLITLPLPLLALAVAGAVLEARLGRRSGSAIRRFVLGLTLAWLVLPIVAAAALHPNLYDGMRHFLFLLPAVAVLAGLGALHLQALIRESPLGRLAWPIVLVVLLLPAISIVRLHPYQASAFNALVGGLGGASGRYDTDYWGASLREAALYVRERAEARSDRPLVLLLGVSSPYPKVAVEYAAGPRVTVVTLGELRRDPEREIRVDYYVGLSRFGMDTFFTGAAIVYRVERDGATLAVVADMQGEPVRAVPVGPADGEIGSTGGLDRPLGTPVGGDRRSAS